MRGGFSGSSSSGSWISETVRPCSAASGGGDVGLGGSLSSAPLGLILAGREEAAEALDRLTEEAELRLDPLGLDDIGRLGDDHVEAR